MRRLRRAGRYRTISAGPSCEGAGFAGEARRSRRCKQVVFIRGRVGGVQERGKYWDEVKTRCRRTRIGWRQCGAGAPYGACLRVSGKREPYAQSLVFLSNLFPLCCSFAARSARRRRIRSRDAGTCHFDSVVSAHCSLHSLSHSPLCIRPQRRPYSLAHVHPRPYDTSTCAVGSLRDSEAVVLVVWPSADPLATLTSCRKLRTPVGVELAWDAV